MLKIVGAENHDDTSHRSIEEWVDLFMARPFPLFKQTVTDLTHLDINSGAATDRYCDSMLHDPGAVVTLLHKANILPRGRLSSDVTTLESAAMLMGIAKVKQLPKQMKTLTLPCKSTQAKGYMQVTSRSFHAAYQAYDWAIQRADMVPKESFIAAFLHDIAEMALWLNGGDEMQQIEELMLSEAMPSDEAQYIVLGFSLEKLSYAFAQRLKLPDLVTDVLSAERASNPRVYGVMLACQLGRLAEHGWYTKEMQDCLSHVGEYLELNTSTAAIHVHKSAVEAAKETDYYCAKPAALSLLYPVSPELEDDEITSIQNIPRHFCLMPQVDQYEMVVEQIKRVAKNLDLNALMGLVMVGLHDGLGLNRAVFSMLEGFEHNILKTRYMIGSDNDPEFSQFSIPLDPINLFTHIMKKQQSIWLYPGNHKKYWRLIPDEFKNLTNNDAFFASSLFVEGQAVGLFYADRHFKDCHLDENSYDRFKVLIQLTGKAIEAQRANEKLKKNKKIS